MFNASLSVATGPGSPLPAQLLPADALAALNGLVANINASIGGRLVSFAGSASSSATSGAQVITSINLPLLSQQMTPSNGPSTAAFSGIRVRAGGTYGATTSPKTVSLVIGATSFAFNPTGTTTIPNLAWLVEMHMRKTNTSSQAWFAWGTPSGSATVPSSIFAGAGTASEAETASCTIAVIGTSTAATAGDINVKFLEVEWLP